MNSLTEFCNYLNLLLIKYILCDEPQPEPRTKIYDPELTEYVYVIDTKNS